MTRCFPGFLRVRTGLAAAARRIERFSQNEDLRYVNRFEGVATHKLRSGEEMALSSSGEEEEEEE